MSTDSNLYAICGVSWQLDVIDLEWVSERLPVEEILLSSSSSSIDYQEIMGSDGNEGLSGNVGGTEAANKWIDAGDDLSELKIDDNNIHLDEDEGVEQGGDGGS